MHLPRVPAVVHEIAPEAHHRCSCALLTQMSPACPLRPRLGPLRGNQAKQAAGVDEA